MKQSTALDILKIGENVFITGSAGTGKTYLLNEYIRYLKERQVFPAIVAPTGLSASHIKGQTIHSFFGIGIREIVDNAFIEVLLRRRYLKSRFKSVEVLIIDEISMVSPELFSSMDRVLQAFKNSPKPFGGVQVIASGDFFQLPPIFKEQTQQRFAWQSPSWRDLDFRTSYLELKFRQDDSRLIDVLDDMSEIIATFAAWYNSSMLSLGEFPTAKVKYDFSGNRLYGFVIENVDFVAISKKKAC